MKHIEFKGKYAEKLLMGEKKSTIRRRVYFKPGELVYVHSGGKIIGKARIKSIKEISIEEIDEEIARKEGFSSVDELIEELKQYYSDSDKLYFVEFDFEPFQSPVDPGEFHYFSNDLIEIAKKAIESEEFSEREKEILRLFIKTGSIRKTAFRLGGLWQRGIVRDVLRKAVRIVNEQK